MYGKFKSKLEEKTTETVIYKQYSTNESLKLLLAAGQEGSTERPNVFVIGAGLNEVASTAPKKAKGREETIRSVADAQNTIIVKQGEKDAKSIFFLVPPFLRKEPAWLDATKQKLMAMHMAEGALKYNPGNVFVGSNIPIDEGDLSDDKIHLNDDGLLKLSDAIIADMLVALADVRILHGHHDPMDEDEEATEEVAEVVLASSQLASSWAATPRTSRKRSRNVEISPSDAGAKKSKESDVGDGLTRGLVETLTQFMQEMRENRKVDEDSLKKVEEKQKTTDEKVEKLTEIVDLDKTIIAAMREDVDASENESMKSAVVVKKLVASDGIAIPVEKKELSKYVQACGRKRGSIRTRTSQISRSRRGGKS